MAEINIQPKKKPMWPWVILVLIIVVAAAIWYWNSLSQATHQPPTLPAWVSSRHLVLDSPSQGLYSPVKATSFRQLPFNGHSNVHTYSYDLEIQCAPLSAPITFLIKAL